MSNPWIAIAVVDPTDGMQTLLLSRQGRTLDEARDALYAHMYEMNVHEDDILEVVVIEVTGSNDAQSNHPDPGAVSQQG